MKILIFNWRDTMNPSSGGAEILTHELAKRWVREGNEVIQFSSFFEGAKKHEVIDGVKIVREGTADARYLWKSVHFRAFFNYQKKFKGKVDVVLDEIHGLPFFTTLYIKERKIALICEVADDLWYKMYGFFFGFLGRVTEIIYLRLLYQSIHFLTISESSRNDLLRNGIDQKKISVIPMGVHLLGLKKLPPKEKNPTLLFVGRLSKPKGIEDAILILEKVKKNIPNAKLWIIGRGDKIYAKFLKAEIKRKKLQNSTIFWGFISEEKKFDLMSRAHILIVPSIKEGFGLTLPEAGSVGTPTIAYNVGGPRDIIQNGRNGIVVDPNPKSASEAVFRILRNDKIYKIVQAGARELVSKYDFDTSAKSTILLIQKHAK